GPWQMGHKEAKEYGRLAAETAKAMKLMDSSLEFVVCGSSFVDMPTFAEWEASVLKEAYDYVDYVSLHQYFKKDEDDTADFLAKTDDLEFFLNSIIATCDYVKATKHSKKTINLSFDEWNVWYHSIDQDNQDMDKLPWRRHPHLLEDIYTFEDAVVDGLAIITLLKHSDRVKIACLAQLVNVIAPVMTEEGKNGRAWRQSIYYPFCHASKYGRGYALEPLLETGKHDTSKHEEVTDVEAIAVYNEEAGEVTVFAVNRNTEEEIEFEAVLKGFEGYSVKEMTVLESEDMEAVNSAEEEKVRPFVRNDHTMDGNVFNARLKPVSWNVIRFSKV
ncbi:MAG TPA: alpha-N-arabinofuranosidase, partial [Lachnospiraceae bacterium]|nr:alpha-N-arabinofuranosidase [Lachnospiraceae bacterium]